MGKKWEKLGGGENWTGGGWGGIDPGENRRGKRGRPEKKGVKKGRNPPPPPNSANEILVTIASEIEH